MIRGSGYCSLGAVVSVVGVRAFALISDHTSGIGMAFLSLKSVHVTA